MASNTSKYVISLEVDKSGAVQNIDKVSEQLDKATNSAASMRSELKKMQQELSNLDQGSKEFQDLAKKAGELKDKMNDAAQAVRANAGNAFESLTNNSRNLKDSLLNLDFEGVAASLKGVAGAAGGIKFSDLTNGLKSVGQGFATLGKALLTNPLFLIITGITLLIANFDKLTTALDGVTAAQEEQAKAAQESSDAAKAQYDWVSANENTLKLQGKSEREIVQLKKDALKVAIEEQKVAIERQRVILQTQVEAAERNKKILTGILDFLSLPLKGILKTVDMVGSALGQDFGLAAGFDKLTESIASAVFDPKAMQEEGEKTLAEAKKNLEQLENTQAGFILAERKAAQDAAKQREADRLKERQELSKQLEAVAAIQKKINEEIQKDQGGKNSVLSKLISESDEKFKILEDQAALEKELRDKTIADEIAAVDAKYIALREKAHGDSELLKQLAIANAEAVTEIENKAAQDRAANEQKVLDAKLSLTADGLSAIINLTNSFQAKNEAQAKKQFEINKGLSIAEALISTYKSINAIFASAAANPASVLFPGYPFIQAGLAAAAGLAQVNKIRQTKFGSTGGGGSAPSSGSGGGGAASTGGGGGQSSGAPAFNPVNTSFINDRPKQAPRAYVLAGDVINQTEAHQKVQEQARL
jgi:DNA repair exonuclease SbcCD ATPase subunit